MKKIFTLSAIVSLAACSGSYNKVNEKFMNDFNQGSYESAASTMASATVAKEKSSDKYLGGLQCGTGYLWANKSEKRDACFAAASEASKDGNKLISSDASGYTIKNYERIALKTYQGISGIIDGSEQTNTFFNDAYSMQDRNVQENRKEISKANEEMEKSKKELAKSGLKFDIAGLKRQALAEMDAAKDGVAPARDYANPYMTYLHALYSTMNKDKDNTGLYYKRLKAWSPKNTFVKSDENEFASNRKNVWIMFENGSVGEIKKRYLAPEILRAFGVKMTIPDVFPGTPAVDHLHITAGNKSVDTEFFANMDSVVKTDFDKYKTEHIIESVAYEVGKFAAAEVAREQAKKSSIPFIREGADVAFLAIMSVEYPFWDLRSWQSLPHEIQTARIEMPADRKLVINGEYNVEIPEDINNAIVFVRIPTVKAKPAIVVGKLN